jgi:hypothetical protein
MLAGENTVNAFRHPKDESFRVQINIEHTSNNVYEESSKVDVLMSELHYTHTAIIIPRPLSGWAGPLPKTRLFIYF